MTEVVGREPDYDEDEPIPLERELSDALLGHDADLRLRFLQVQALVEMIDMRRDKFVELLPLLREASDVPPAAVRKKRVWQSRLTTADGQHIAWPEAWTLPKPNERTIRVLARERYRDRTLSPEQVALAQDIADGRSMPEISAAQGLPTTTIHARFHRLGNVLGLKDSSRVTIVAECFRRGYID